MNNMAKLRKERGLNMKETASQLGIPYTTYIGYEKSEREPPFEILVRIANFFSASIDYLLGHSNDRVDERILDIVNAIDNDILENCDSNLNDAIANQEARDLSSAKLVENVERLCKQNGVKFGTVAAQLGIAKGLLTELRAGRAKNMSLDSFIKIADYFDVSLDELVSRKKEAPDQARAEKYNKIIDMYSKLSEQQQALFLSLIDNLLQANQ